MPNVSKDQADELLRRARGWSLRLGLGATVAVGALWSWEVALGVLCGVTLGWLNLWMLGHALVAVLAQAGGATPTDRKWAMPGLLLLKWPLTLLALVCVLWYLPARPEGVVLGWLLALTAGGLAALTSTTGQGSRTSGE